ncbi:MAG: hypothetical protein ABEJ68_00540 [Halobacteriaceae archaeon]
MPAKTGASHGFAAFAALVTGTMLSKFIWNLSPSIGELSLSVIRVVRSTTGADLPVTEQFAGTVAVMVGLSFLWGVVYHFGRHS